MHRQRAPLHWSIRKMFIKAQIKDLFEAVRMRDSDHEPGS